MSNYCIVLTRIECGSEAIYLRIKQKGMLEDFIFSTWSISYMKNEERWREKNSESKFFTFYIVYLQIFFIVIQ